MPRVVPLAAIDGRAGITGNARDLGTEHRVDNRLQITRLGNDGHGEHRIGVGNQSVALVVAALTTIPDWVPVMLVAVVSVAVSDWLPVVFRVTLKVWTPLSAATKV